MDATDIAIAVVPGVLAAAGSYAVLRWRVTQVEQRRTEDRGVLDAHLADAARGFERLAVVENTVDVWERRFTEFRSEVRELLGGIGKRNEERWDRIEARIDARLNSRGEG